MSTCQAEQLASQCKVVIIEQPAPKNLRFRYPSESRLAGSLQGISSILANKTYPAIGVTGYQGRALVVVSCVTIDAPYRPHPYNLVGREGCENGVCTLQIPPERMALDFPNLGIQCVKRKAIQASLNVRQEIGVDPFATGFEYSENFKDITLNAVRLCFQVLLEYQGQYSVPLTPVISEPIFDKKGVRNLKIVKLSETEYPVNGGLKDIILLCDKVPKEDIALRFFEEQDDHLVWETIQTVPPYHVHKQSAISFKSPRYKTMDISEPVEIFVQLLMPSKGDTGEAVAVTFLPLHQVSTTVEKLLKRRENTQSAEESQNALNNFDIHRNLGENRNMDVSHPAIHLNIPYNNSNGVFGDLDVPVDINKFLNVDQNSKLMEISLSSGELSDLSARLSDSLSIITCATPF